MSSGQRWYAVEYLSIIKDFCLCLKDNHRINFEAGNYTKECQLNRAKPRELKENSYKLSKTLTIKERSIATFSLTNLGKPS